MYGQQTVPLTKASNELTPPTHTRYKLIFFAVTLAIITYVDRVCISQSAPLIRSDLGLTEVQMGWAFAAFSWSYALFEIPGGWLGDRMGARRVLTRVVVWWSLFTAATGWAKGFTSLLMTRALFGAGEAGCFPNLTRAFTSWLPKDERVRAQGYLWLAARWGGAFTPLGVALLLDYLSWRRAFEIFGLLGIIWAFFFYRWYRDDPSQHKQVNAGEIAIMPPAEAVSSSHGPIPWKSFLRSRTVWLLCLQFILLNYGWAFYITWLPTYLREERHLALKHGAFLAGLPLFFGGLGSLFAGSISNRLAGWLQSVTSARRWLAGLGFFGASICLLISFYIHDPLLALSVMGLASFANDLVMPTSWGTCMDIGGRFSGTLSGAMNMMGNIGGGLAPLAIGYILNYSGHNWAITFYIASAVYFLGVFCWIFIDPVTPLDSATN
jgi:ACS family glucarate transporter-like MFS transporter